MAKKVAKKKVWVTCHYCKMYYESKNRVKKFEGKTPVYTRLCEKTGEYKRSNNKICDEFVLAPSFWCKRNGYWLSPSQCMNRDCERCKQRSVVKKGVEYVKD